MNLTVSMPQDKSATPSARSFVAPGPLSSGKSEHNSGGHPGASTAAEIVGGQTANGVTAYQQLRDSNNPYDPKFDRNLQLGTATVGQPTAAKADAASKAEAATPDAAKHE